MSRPDMGLAIPAGDADTLRRLAARQAEIAASDDNHARRRAWLALDAGGGHRPMVLAEADMIKDANFPLNTLPQACESALGRSLERQLRGTIWKFEHLHETLEIGAGRRLEIIMRTVPTLADEPDRLARWVDIAKSEIGG